MSNNENKFRSNVDLALDEDHEIEFKTTYLNIAYDNIKNTYDKLIGSAKIATILIIVFELLIRASISEVDISGFKLKDISLIQKIIPVGISFMFYNTTTVYLFFLTLNITFHSIIKVYAPLYHKYDLDFIILPPSPNNITSFFDFINKDHKSRIIIETANNIGAGFVGLFFLGVPIFILYAYYKLLVTFGMYDILTWVSAVFSIVIIIKTFIILFIHKNLD